MIRVFHNLQSISGMYKTLDMHSSPLQKYEIVKQIFSFPYFIEPLFYNIRKIRTYNIYIVYDENEPVLIFPTTKQGDELFVMAGKEWDYVDAVYKTKEFDVLKNAFVELFTYVKAHGIRKIQWFYLGEKTLSYKVLTALQGKIVSFEACPEVNVNIPIDYSTYDEYFSHLSKSVRQNCRTAHNRLSKDGKEIKLVTHFFAKNAEHQISSVEADRLYKDCMAVYLDRQKNRYHQPTQYVLREKYYDYVTKSIKTEHGFISAFFIDKQIASALMGYYDKTKSSILVPRVAINDKYSEYSPGICLLTETIRYLIELNIKNLDLCDGDEKYKYDLGGEQYFTAKLVMDIL